MHSLLNIVNLPMGNKICICRAANPCLRLGGYFGNMSQKSIFFDFFWGGGWFHWQKCVDFFFGRTINLPKNLVQNFKISMVFQPTIPISCLFSMFLLFFSVKMFGGYIFKYWRGWYQIIGGDEYHPPPRDLRPCVYVKCQINVFTLAV